MTTTDGEKMLSWRIGHKHLSSSSSSAAIINISIAAINDNNPEMFETKGVKFLCFSNITPVNEPNM